MTPNPPGQYSDDRNLSARQRLWHNQTPFFDIAAWVLGLAGVSPGMRVLDAGCGNGVYLRTLRERRVRAAGCDLSMGMLRAAAHPALVNADVSALPVRDGAVDVVLAAHMLDLVPDRRSALRELRRVLAPDGVCVAVTNGSQTLRSLRELVEKAVHGRDPGWRMIPPTRAFAAENAPEQLGVVFGSVSCVRPASAGPVVIRDAAVAADYVASLASHYQDEVSRPWDDVVGDVRHDVQAVIDSQGRFTTRSDLSRLSCAVSPDGLLDQARVRYHDARRRGWTGTHTEYISHDVEITGREAAVGGPGLDVELPPGRGGERTTMGQLTGLRALVTGGASGLGAAIATAFAAEGAAVVVLDMADEPPAGLPAGVGYVRADVTDDAAVRSAVDAAAGRLGGLDLLVNNAGIGAQGSVADSTDEEWQRVLDVNVIGTARVSRAAWPYLRESGQAAVVNTASIAATAGLPDRAVYSASKGAVAALTRAMAADGMADRVRVNAVNPGTADTPWVSRLLDAAPDPEVERAALEARQPHGRLVTAEEVAAAVVYLASPAAGSTTGTELAVDGGMGGLRLRPRT